MIVVSFGGAFERPVPYVLPYLWAMGTVSASGGAGWQRKAGCAAGMQCV